MDSLFKQKLLSLRHPAAVTTFAEAILGDISWLSRLSSEMDRPLAKEVYSEKVQVIESLERFAQEKTNEQKTNILKIDGGEILVRSEPTWDEIHDYSSFAALKAELSLDARFLEIVLAGKEPGKVKALFVSEKFRLWEELAPELKEGFINELIVGFPVKTAELFERMILAMKLDPSEVIIYPIEGIEDKDYAAEVMKVAAYFKPEVIITLGAKASNKILKSSDRLSLVHGQFFARKISSVGTFQVVPLFHPSIIETNQNMKKTAWVDMQKIMKYLKKIP